MRETYDSEELLQPVRDIIQKLEKYLKAAPKKPVYLHAVILDPRIKICLFSKHAGLGLISVAYNYQNAVWHLDYSREVQGKRIPSFSAKLANADPRISGDFTPDYSTDPSSVPVIAAADILNGHFDPNQIKGKDVVIGTASEGIGDLLVQHRELRLARERPDVGVVGYRVADLEAAHRVDEGLDEGVMDRLVHVDAFHRAAALAGVVHRAIGE